jgi:hypothetical protein
MIVGALIGGTTNMTYNCDPTGSFKQNFRYFAAGAVVGAASSVAGAGMSMATNFVGTLAGSGVGAVTGASISAIGNVTLNGVNNCYQGNNFWYNADKSAISGAISGGISGAISGGIQGYQNAKMLKYTNPWTGRIDYQSMLNDAVAAEGINNPNSQWLVANKKNANLVNKTFNNVTKVRGNKIYMPDGTYSDLGVTFGTKNKGNISLISKQAIRDKGFVSLTDVLRHEGTHQVQILSGMTTVADKGLAMECGAYMTNMLYPSTLTSSQSAFILLTSPPWNVNYSVLWENLINFYQYGPLP